MTEQETVLKGISTELTRTGVECSFCAEVPNEPGLSYMAPAVIIMNKIDRIAITITIPPKASYIKVCAMYSTFRAELGDPKCIDKIVNICKSWINQGAMERVYIFNGLQDNN